jgi:hypothetical protein
VWGFVPDDPISNLVSSANKQFIQLCADCHSRRLLIAEKDPNTPADYHAVNTLSLLSTDLYFDDGQIKDEVFVMGSFLQSEMSEAGVTCSNCHNPHSGKLKLIVNHTCTPCHSASTYDMPAHHQHKVDSAGSQCVDCYMPARTYMQIGDRRDHSFVIPKAAVSGAIDSRNARLNCHQQEHFPWVAKQLKACSSEKSQSNSILAPSTHWSKIHLLSGEQQLAYTQQNLAVASPIVGAKLLEIINRQPSQASVSLAIEQLTSEQPLLRRAAINVLRQLPAEQGYQYLYPMLKDPLKSVRFYATSLLASW